MKKIIISILLVVPILVCIITIIPISFIYDLTIKMCDYVFSDVPDYINDVEVMEEKIYNKYENLSYEQQLNLLYAVEKMVDEQYNKKNNK